MYVSCVIMDVFKIHSRVIVKIFVILEINITKFFLQKFISFFLQKFINFFLQKFIDFFLQKLIKVLLLLQPLGKEGLVSSCVVCVLVCLVL